MAMAWVRGEKLDPTSAEKQIIEISDFEFQKYGSYEDTSADDTVARIFNAYFKYYNAAVQKNITAEDIKAELAKGHLVIVPANGKRLGNPHYKNGGPLTHMLVITGYDNRASEFITNDSGTRFGFGYRYKYSTLINAVYDYSTGNHEPQPGVKTAMIAVSK
jgi:hypothetical protein